ncbi:PHP domain protein [Caldithrix abyssi DSM 13497]|uniref:PHP domain protein n=1 Tax=Caldithrix abyssi DSM 13497 TaxID=880073 RepID=H1XXK2_CALAY|nr:PHP domain-containing protein [Caldithrix abyssi]APF19215.1 hypothetical protein Cabys_2466 [Caldithrix abyssi DSM 13497]EHO43126.1 PHP domain protein [Caldithrix abyssi DSM 13497]
MAVDLHLHTTHSDGSLTPSQLVQLLKKLGVKTFAITDHDTISAIKQADRAAHKNGMRLITGVELSIEYPLPGSAHLHLLGLFIDVQNEELNFALKKLREERKNRAHLIIRKLEQMGIELPSSQKEKLVLNNSVARPHIAQILLQEGLVKSMEEAFQKYIGRNAPAYVPKKKFQLKEAIDLVHRAGGLAIVAHPVSLGAKTDAELRDHLDALVSCGIDGLEAYYPLHDPPLTRYLLNYAEEKRLAVSGGSDFHGEAKKEIQPVIGDGRLNVPDEIVTQLDAFYREKYG